MAVTKVDTFDCDYMRCPSDPSGEFSYNI